MIKPYEIELYRTNTGKEPYTEWERSLDQATMARIDARLTRIREVGNIGKCEPVGNGVYELKFDFGPGYRIYFGLEKDTDMILLLGGCKKSQQRDIDKSKKYWEDHLLRKRGKNEKI
jgi:putative addiction module killer protein